MSSLCCATGRDGDPGPPDARGNAASGHRRLQWSDRMREPEHRRCCTRGFAPNLLTNLSGTHDRLQFLLDGKPAELPKQGVELEGHRVTAFDAGGETGLRIDYAHGPVLMVTPHFWTSYGLWYLDVSVSNTNGDEGVMGRIPQGTWLPDATERRDGRPHARRAFTSAMSRSTRPSPTPGA